MSTSKACCTIPPVVADTDSYDRKGNMETIANLRTCKLSHLIWTGPLIVQD